MQIKRGELYQLVCSKPLSKVAPQFDTDGTKLAAICRENNVPYPGSGYWTPLALGKDADLPLLPPTDDGQDPLITILPHQPKQRRERIVSANDEQQEAEQQSPRHEAAEPNAKPQPSPLVKDRLVKPHPLIAGWIADHERRRREARSSPRLVDLCCCA